MRRGGGLIGRRTATRWMRCAAVLVALVIAAPGQAGRSFIPIPEIILDPNEDKTVENGELGEICIAGVGLALGYMNRDELTMKKFIRDFLNIRNNPSGRIYRTGDLGRIDENGDIEYRGRIDTQVKIRGYRIELEAIESRLTACPDVREAACRVQGEGPQQQIVAFVVPANPAVPPHFDALKLALRWGLASVEGGISTLKTKSLD